LALAFSVPDGGYPSFHLLFSCCHAPGESEYSDSSNCKSDQQENFPVQYAICFCFMHKTHIREDGGQK